MADLTVLPLEGIGEVRPGDDLAEILVDAAPWLAEGDVLVVTSKVVSKAEGRLVPIPPAEGPEREAARAELIDAETARPVARRGETRIVQTHHGLVLASAGIDVSNVDRGHAVLLPVDPDASAHRIRSGIRQRLRVHVAVIVSDTMGRPWRNGLTDVAIGAAGIGALHDHRGSYDAHGNELSVTQVAVIDELAAAADLVKGKADGIPAAVIRGYVPASTGAGARALVRDAELDLFSLGTAEARAEGLRAAATLADAPSFVDGPVPGDAIERALSIVDASVERTAGGDGLPPFTREVLKVKAESDVKAGMDVQRLRAALAAEGLASVWLPDAGLLAVGVTAGR
ncbi:hypothetical protein Val02_79710 [Virgisporangium aliadipatigenens]|uniref:Coenzyme F420:L-glutamate ligase-like domain-containing protein n=1 Tax=Virgisporangium aliadipatigenens TaxID=741659 RepID=A0A8J4DU95_9ACTN|nr:coenzyme F420-0:L-glutamate ligase [Virgisporangium aliadipatigenens]GIJ51085.1 hypothetical protein Val02_79710 [Virgisporangium aliadipatigenens]